MVNGTDLDRAVERGSNAALQELAAFCAQESISAQDRGMEAMAGLVTAALLRRGFTTRLVPTRRHRQSSRSAGDAAIEHCSSTTTTTCSRPSRWTSG